METVSTIFNNDFRVIQLDIMLYIDREELYHFYYTKESNKPFCDTDQHQISIILTKEFVKKKHGETYLWKNKKN